MVQYRQLGVQQRAQFSSPRLCARQDLQKIAKRTSPTVCIPNESWSAACTSFYASRDSAKKPSPALTVTTPSVSPDPRAKVLVYPAGGTNTSSRA